MALPGFVPGPCVHVSGARQQGPGTGKELPFISALQAVASLANKAPGCPSQLHSPCSEQKVQNWGWGSHHSQIRPQSCWREQRGGGCYKTGWSPLRDGDVLMHLTTVGYSESQATTRTWQDTPVLAGGWNGRCPPCSLLCCGPTELPASTARAAARAGHALLV